ncbi:hypothetical protein [Streptomyces canus]|nr:hypothetical protein [Streptomyces canus]WSD92742.1 hypothetical protein OG925_51775 [Streptomyces canus]
MELVVVVGGLLKAVLESLVVPGEFRRNSPTTVMTAFAVPRDR